MAYRMGSADVECVYQRQGGGIRSLVTDVRASLFEELGMKLQRDRIFGGLESDDDAELIVTDFEGILPGHNQ
ncbi:hypothetical protein LTS18_008364 [Coniosporium uncinatum]|uniref:Uncharacterized protein n=1 Tax=Coniosporium uncinatum TaxID=93489 RepID=A0ACC3D1R1_9PEZI|nr:hypothetical protein LTS18_008364 [Coniosporium uncinatum]